MSDVFNAVSTIAGTAFHGGLGAFQTMDFGKKGMFAGGALGAAAFLAGSQLQDDENPTLGGALASGFVTGSIQSAFSTAQELYAFHNPHHVSAMSSINTTTTAASLTNAIHAGLKGDLRGASLHMFKPDNFMTDLTRYGMISGSLSGAADKIKGYVKDLQSKTNPDGTKTKDTRSLWEKTKGGAKAAYEISKDYVKDNLAASEAKTPWFSTEPTEIKTPILNTDTDEKMRVGDASSIKPGERRKPIQGAGDVAYHTTRLSGTESMGERARMFVEANRAVYDSVFEGFNHLAEQDPKLKEMGLTQFKNAEEYGRYLSNIEGGALGTYKELKAAGMYDKGGSKLKHAISLGQETFMGSPAWARTVDKQLTNGTATLHHENGKVHFKGGGKWGRIAAAAADIAVGGAINAAGNALLYAATAPFHSNKNNPKVSSNRAYNTI